MALASTAAGQTFVPDPVEGADLFNPTSLDWGPDGRLYIAEQYGVIRILDVSRDPSGDYSVSATDSITLIFNLPNRDDDGVINPLIPGRQVTGIVAAGTASNPILYVSNSDPRGFNSASDTLRLDTNSGMVSRLTWTGSSWDMVHLVRGLPRSANGHSINGMSLDEAGNRLFLVVGGHTNMGATSSKFGGLPEYALAAAILEIDLAALDLLPIQTDGSSQWIFDLSTLDDPNPLRDTGVPGVDLNDPFGGAFGQNQAMITASGPVQIHSTGYRNAYDVVFGGADIVYTFDNGPNSGWGDMPIGEGPAGLCTNGFLDGGTTLEDNLHAATPGFYGGHPNPTRANAANTFSGQSPILSANPVECDYLLPGVDDQALLTIPASTNGLWQYKASNFGGDMAGDLLAASYDGSIYRVQLDSTGLLYQAHEALFSGFCIVPLDVTAQDDSEIFPGTIWVTCIGDGFLPAYQQEHSPEYREPCQNCAEPVAAE